MENNVKDVPYIVYEGAVVRAERHSKRLIIALIISIIMIAITNIVWIFMWNSYEYIGDAASYYQDGEGNNVIGDNNSLYGTENDQGH